MNAKLVILVPIIAATLVPTERAQAAEDKATFSKCMDVAEQIASRMTPGREKDVALNQVIFAYSRAGLVEPSLTAEKMVAIDNEIVDHHAQIQALLSAVTYSNPPTEGEKTADTVLLRRALALVPTDPQAWSRDNLLWQIAGSFTEIGQIDEARDATKLIEAPDEYNHALYQIAEAQAYYQHDFAAAIATAESMQSSSQRAEVFAYIARSALRIGDKSRADYALAQAGQSLDFGLRVMAEAKSEVHDFRAALELAQQIVNEGIKKGAIQQVGEDAAAAGALDVARPALREAHARQREEGFALADIATAQAKIGLFDDAMATIDDLEKLPFDHRSVMNGNDLVFALGNIAKEQARHGRLTDARQTLDRARPNLNGGADSASIASDAVTIGEIAWAREVANGLQGLARFRALQWIARGLAKRGDFDGAEATAADIERQQNPQDPIYDFADDAREDIAVVQISHSRIADAFETVSRIHRPVAQVFALTRMAAATVRKCISADAAFCDD